MADELKRSRDKRADFRRREAAPWRSWYKTARWQSLRQVVFARDLFTCQRCGRLLPDGAAVADHRTAHKGDAALFWDAANVQTLCKPCHDGAKQSEEARGYSTEIGADGFPIDPRHPANR